MRKGLLAQWRGRIVGRGTAAAALLAIPVAVAAAIGFSEGLGGVVRGFDAIDGPEPAAAGAEAGPGGGLDAALVALVGDDDGGSGGGDGGPTPNAPGAPGGPGGPGGAGGSPAPGTGPALELPGSPGVQVPVEDPSGSVDSLVDDVNRTVDGLLGNR